MTPSHKKSNTVYTQSRNNTQSGNSDEQIAWHKFKLNLNLDDFWCLPKVIMSWTASAKEIDMLLLSSLISYFPTFDAFLRGLTLPSLGYFIFAKSTFAVPGGLFAHNQCEYQQNATCQWSKSSLENSSKNQPPGTRTLRTRAGVHQARGFESWFMLQFWWLVSVIFRRTSPDAVEEVGCEVLFVQVHGRRYM